MEECPLFSEDLASIYVLLIEHSATLVLMSWWIRSSYRSVELAHPMYGLLYQEMIVLALSNFLNAIVLLSVMLVDNAEVGIAAGLYIIIDVAALQFHQVTCLSVACIRYFTTL